MIWFPCKHCGKVHGRPENSAGTMIFCDCGQGVTVPWESTAAPTAPASTAELPTAMPAVEAPALGAAMPLPGPRLEPLKFESVPVVAPVSPPPLPSRRDERGPRFDDRDRERDRDYDRPRRPEKRPARYRPDPNFCLNHPALASKQTCADCREAFCTDCVVAFQGEALCGPCKNFRARTLEVAPKVSGAALTSLIMGLIAGPLIICMLPAGRWMGSSYLALIVLLPQLAALVLGVMGLRTVEANPKVGGWSLALTGVLTATVASFLTVLVVVFGARLGV
jgi:hypothetical protein